MSDATRHQVWMDHVGNQQWLACCSCGWRGRQKNGKPFWGRDGAFAALVGHKRDFPEVDLSRPSIVDSTKVVEP